MGLPGTLWHYYVGTTEYNIYNNDINIGVSFVRASDIMQNDAVQQWEQPMKRYGGQSDQRSDQLPLASHCRNQSSQHANASTKSTSFFYSKHYDADLGCFGIELDVDLVGNLCLRGSTPFAYGGAPNLA